MVEMVMGGGATRENLVERLFAAFATQVRDIEARVREGAQIAEDSRVLSGLAKTLETLLTLDRKVASPSDAAPDVDRLRTELSARLAKLRPAKRKAAAVGTA